MRSEPTARCSSMPAIDVIGLGIGGSRPPASALWTGTAALLTFYCGPSQILAMVERRANRHCPPFLSLSCRTFRPTGVNAHLLYSALLDHVLQIATYVSSRAPMIYDRTGDHISLNEIKRIAISTTLRATFPQSVGDQLRRYEYMQSS